MADGFVQKVLGIDLSSCRAMRRIPAGEHRYIPPRKRN
jgi:hypothetical protein